MKARPGGFSLVEVTLALGIVVFGLVVILGLLPGGLGLIKNNSDETTAAAIAMAIQADVESVPEGVSNTPRFGIPLKTVNSGKAFFDLEGTWLGNGTADSASSAYPNAAYSANWVVRARSNDAPPSAAITICWPANAPKPTGWFDALLILGENPQ